MGRRKAARSDGSSGCEAASLPSSAQATEPQTRRAWTFQKETLSSRVPLPGSLPKSASRLPTLQTAPLREILSLEHSADRNLAHRVLSDLSTLSNPSQGVLGMH